MKPNMIFILADDMGYGDIGVFGNRDVQTPALDQLSSESLLLTQHYSASPVCAPARASILTGRYPHRTGAIDTLEGRGLDRLALSETTLPDILKTAGYTTGIIGKWHLGALDPRYHPNSRGFDEFVGFRGGWSDYWQWRLDYNRQLKNSDGRYLTDVFTEEAISFIERHQKEPFFLHLTYNAPHFPLQVPDEEIEPFRLKDRFTEGVCRIYAMNRRMDKGIARVLETLERLGLGDNTFLIFTSDNGPQFGGQGDMCTTRFNAHFNGSKGNVFEGGIRVPAIVRWRAGFDTKGPCDLFFHFTDWMPTLLASAGIEPPGEIRFDGENLLPALQGEPQNVNPKRFWQWNRYQPIPNCNTAMRDGDWKLIRPAIKEAMFITREERELDRKLKYEPDSITDICRSPAPEREIPEPHPPLLFDLENDPYEQNNLAEVHPDRVQRMQSELDKWFEQVEAERRAVWEREGRPPL